jgi:hypothetical protein
MSFDKEPRRNLQRNPASLFSPLHHYRKFVSLFQVLLTDLLKHKLTSTDLIDRYNGAAKL